MKKLEIWSLEFGIYLVIGIWLLVIAAVGGCGQQQVQSTTTTTLPGSSGVTIVIKGSTSTGVTGLGVRAYSPVITNAEVTLTAIASLGVSGITQETQTLSRAETDAGGSYSLSVLIGSLEAFKNASGLVPNLMVTISKEGTVIGCVIPTLSTEAGGTAYAPTSDPGGYAKLKIARNAFKKGIDPKTFDFSSSIDDKFTGSMVASYDAAKLDALAEAIKSGEDAESGIATALGISPEMLALLKQKGFDLHRLYIEPIMRTAFEAKTPPSREQMDTAFASMDAAVMDYARSLGLTEDQIANLRAMKNDMVEGDMSAGGKFAGDPGFEEAKRRMKGDEITSLFLGQWEAANTLANTSGSPSFAAAYPGRYAEFQASREVIVAQLTALISNPTFSPEAIPRYLRDSFFDVFLYPPPGAMPPPPPPGTPYDPASIEAAMAPYKSTRIMTYFLETFFNPGEKMTLFTSMESNMKKVFRDRFENTSSPFYMGPNFWATMPSPTEIQNRLTLFNTALTNAVDNNPALKDLFIAHFGAVNGPKALAAFRILSAPPDMF